MDYSTVLLIENNVTIS